ncbi:hypothetical protein BB561_002954 [Smittium simulii]|uniref:CRAL-TRIO domain-containing protein n=1 Tax=Smittium simulii TaxID=133385 RepID=A0A2T9YNJ9_9FUNG|nr:hypothetical protein BB561_002954 [Smittium simulii]
MEKKDLDNISPEEQAKVIAEVRAALPPKISEFCNDSTIWRFSVARQLETPKIVDMLEKWHQWRIDDGIDKLFIPKPDNVCPIPYPIRGYADFADSNLVASPEIPDAMMRMNSLFGGGCWHKVDKKGHPLYIDRLGSYDIKGIPKLVTVKELLQNHYLLQEFCLNAIMPSCSKTAGREISKQTVIFDLAGVNTGMFNMSALNMLKEMLANDQLYFPESMYKTFFVNVPVMFVTVWSVVKPWLDPRVLSKIQVLGKNYSSILLEHIEAENLPLYLGGKCTCSHMPGGCVPSPPKHNYIDLPRTTFTELRHRAKISYDEPQYTTTFTTTDVDKENSPTPTQEKKGGWFTKKKVVKVDNRKYVAVILSTSAGRGIVFEALFKAQSSPVSTQPQLLYPETMFETQRAPTILEIKLPEDDFLGEITLNFRLPRADEGNAPLPKAEETQEGVTLEFDVMMEHDIIKKYDLPVTDREGL